MATTTEVRGDTQWFREQFSKDTIVLPKPKAGESRFNINIDAAPGVTLKSGQKMVGHPLTFLNATYRSDDPVVDIGETGTEHADIELYNVNVTDTTLREDQAPTVENHPFSFNIHKGTKRVKIISSFCERTIKGILSNGTDITIENFSGVPLFRGIEVDTNPGFLYMRNCALTNPWVDPESVAGEFQSGANGCTGFVIRRVQDGNAYGCVCPTTANYFVGGLFAKTSEVGVTFGGPNMTWYGGSLCCSSVATANRVAINVAQTRPSIGETDSGEGIRGVQFLGTFIDGTPGGRTMRIQTPEQPDLLSRVMMLGCVINMSGDGSAATPHAAITVRGDLTLSDCNYICEDSVDGDDFNYFLRMDLGRINWSGGIIQGRQGVQAVQLHSYTNLRIWGVTGLGGTGGPITSGRINDQTSGLTADTEITQIDQDMLFAEYAP